ncbi:MAG: enoyl-CoA hydratase/isomerase family protein [Desulfatiglans sp.]|nr:enoyl-CoA hydratase/isomerase family protein [Desulfatiglans sp.]
MQYSCLSYEVRDRIALITLNRPEKLNSLTQVFWREIRKALEVGDQNSEVLVHMITGNGRAFCAGDDISVLTRLKNPSDADDLFINCIYGLVDTIAHLTKPMISVVNGFAYGGGCELVLLSDLGIASEKATFALPEGRIGAFPAIFSAFGPALLGLKATNELSLTGKPVSARRAFDIGLVNRVVPHEDLMKTSTITAEQVIQSSPVALRIIKETSSKILGDNLHHFWVSCQRFSREVARTDDFLEGATAFMEKRAPKFLGH